MTESALQMVGLAAIGGFLPALVWLYFWHREDNKRPEPGFLVLRAFLAGCVAVLVAFFLERPLLGFFGPLKSSLFSFPEISLENIGQIIIFSIPPIIWSWSLIEELVKYLFGFLGVFQTKHFDEPIDAMIYMITIALGFAAAENTLFLFDVLSRGETDLYFLLTGNLRFLGATVIHTVCSALVGATVAMAWCGPRWKKIAYPIFGLLTATLLHAMFNFFIILNDGQHAFIVLSILWLSAMFVIFLFERVKKVVCYPKL